jgi:HAD superfamily hydrolase (TIGR01509 family)
LRDDRESGPSDLERLSVGVGERTRKKILRHSKSGRYLGLMSRAAIFDTDGVLIDSEPLWWRAGVEALHTVDVHLDDRLFGETLGLRTDAALAYWYERYPWAGKSLKQIEQEVQERVLGLIGDEGQSLPGVHSLIHFLSERRVPIGVCSSSPYQVIHAVLDRLGIRQHFQVVYSAEDEPLGKPHPGAYLSCAARLGIPAPRCMAFEDSMAGAISAKAARMKVIAVLQGIRSTVFDFCDIRIDTLIDFTPDLLDQLLPT